MIIPVQQFENFVEEGSVSTKGSQSHENVILNAVFVS